MTENGENTGSAESGRAVLPIRLWGIVRAVAAINGEGFNCGFTPHNGETYINRLARDGEIKKSVCRVRGKYSRADFKRKGFLWVCLICLEDILLK
jgi:hypothetical protein